MVAAMGAEEEGGDVRRPRRAGEPGEVEVRIGPAVLVAAVAGDARAGRLAAEGQGAAESGAAEFDLIGRLGIGWRPQALALAPGQQHAGIGPRGQPAHGAQRRRAAGGGRQGQCAG